MGRLSKRQKQLRLNLAKMNEGNRRKKLLKRLKQENPIFEEGDVDAKFDDLSEEERSVLSSYSAPGEEYKMEGEDGDDDEEQMEEVECKIEGDEDRELVQDPLGLSDMEALSTATTSVRSATTMSVRSAASVATSSEDAKKRKAEWQRLYAAKKKSTPVNYLSSSTRIRFIRPRPLEGFVGDDGGDHEQPKVCLLCSKEISSVLSDNPSLSSGKDADFLTMFVLKKMLEVPNGDLQDYLRQLGNPRNWISFCSRCKVKMDEVMVVQQEINQLEKILRRFQKEMKNMIAVNFLKNKKIMEDFTGRKSDSLLVTRETWFRVAKESHSTPRRNYSKIAEAEVLPSSSLSPGFNNGQSLHHCRISAQNDSSTSNITDHFNKRKAKLGVRQYSDHTDDDVPTFVEDHDDAQSSIDTNTTTLTVEEWLFDKKWLAKSRFNEKGALTTGGFSCHLCPKLNGMKLEAYVKHILFHKGRPYRCSVCDIFLTGSELELSKLPKMVHKKEGVPEDHKCRKETLIPVTFKVGKFLDCGFCNSESFSSEEERRAHEETVHNEISVPLPYDCSKCSCKFRDYVEWRLHRALEHHDLAKIGCFYCDEIFARKTKEGVDILDSSARKTHILERHGPKTKTTKVEGEDCEFCGETFEARHQLLDHVVAAHGIDRNRAVGCPICLARFPSPTNLSIHYRSAIHFDNVSKEKFICDLCGYENSVSLAFLEHKLIKHDIEPEDGRPIRYCKEDNCSFKCVINSTLKVHMMKEHNADRELKCETCGKGFLNRKHLRDHKRTHSGIKPFQCEICGNSFAVKNYLYIHKRLSHQNRPFASTHKKRTPRRTGGINFQKDTIGTIQNNTPEADKNTQEGNSQIELPTTSPPSEWTTTPPPPQPPYQTMGSGNNFGANYLPDLGSSSSTTSLTNRLPF